MFKTKGSVVTATTIPAAKIEYPLALEAFVEVAHSETIGTMTIIPHKPKITEGIPARISMTVRKTLEIQLGANCVI